MENQAESVDHLIDGDGRPGPEARPEATVTVSRAAAMVWLWSMWFCGPTRGDLGA
jgi:hypothetical protein